MRQERTYVNREGHIIQLHMIFTTVTPTSVFVLYGRVKVEGEIIESV